MLGVETRSGIGMKDFGQREPLGQELGHEGPRNPAPLAAASDYPSPELAHLVQWASSNEGTAPMIGILGRILFQLPIVF